jgi:hypothetical protein
MIRVKRRMKRVALIKRVPKSSACKREWLKRA